MSGAGSAGTLGMLLAHVLLALGAVPVGLYMWLCAGDGTGALCCVVGMLFASSFFKPDSMS